MSDARISAIIVTYKSAPFVAACLDSLERTARDVLKDCIVVDNASSDGTAELIQSGFPWVTVIENERNVGFGSAVNVGVAAAQGDFVLILNPDTIVEPKAVAELASFLAHRWQAAVCGPKIIGLNGQFRRDSRRGFPTPLNAFGYLTGLDRVWPRSRVFGGYHRRDISEDLEILTDSLSGSCMMVRRSSFDAVQGFDEDYFLFGEDIDLCWKLKQAGHEVWYVPSARVVHIKGASMNFAPQMAKREFYHSMRLFVEKRLTGRYPKCVLWATKIGVLCAEKLSQRFRRSRGMVKPLAPSSSSV